MPLCPYDTITAGTAPAEIVYTTQLFLAFLDPKPIQEGHALLVPKRHVARLEDLTSEEAHEIGPAQQELLRMLKRAYGGNGMIWMKDGPQAGQQVPHLHYHLLPRRAGDRLWSGSYSLSVLDTRNTSGFARLDMTTEQLKAAGRRIRGD